MIDRHCNMNEPALEDQCVRFSSNPIITLFNNNVASAVTSSNVVQHLTCVDDMISDMIA